MEHVGSLGLVGSAGTLGGVELAIGVDLALEPVQRALRAAAVRAERSSVLAQE